jgi:hypothetical protein
MEEQIERTLQALKARKLKGFSVHNHQEARDLMLDLIPQGATVGTGGSSTLMQTGIIESLKARGTTVISHFDVPAPAPEYIYEQIMKATLCDVYIAGTNAITEDGRIFNIDGAGNRVAGMFWGHPRVILVVGKNKIVKNLDEAYDRVKNLMAPEHFRILGYGTPCAAKGECIDCVGSKRSCNITTIIEGKPFFSEINVIIVDEDLGLGWDRSWPQERIEAIKAEHKKHMLPFLGKNQSR